MLLDVSAPVCPYTEVSLMRLPTWLPFLDLFNVFYLRLYMGAKLSLHNRDVALLWTCITG